jgi:hypothetical protein
MRVDTLHKIVLAASAVWTVLVIAGLIWLSCAVIRVTDGIQEKREATKIERLETCRVECSGHEGLNFVRDLYTGEHTCICNDGTGVPVQ